MSLVIAAYKSNGLLIFFYFKPLLKYSRSFFGQMGQSLESFLQCKAFVTLLFGCTEAPLHTHSRFFTKFVKVLYYQLKYALQKDQTDINVAGKGPETLLADSFLSGDSFLQHLCKE